jgi:putative ABC transport system permease protein
MLKNILVITIRNIRVQKGIFLITFTGLVTGLSAAFFCYLFVIHELRYDLHHLKKERIYRMVTKTKEGGYFSSTPPVLKETIENEFPEIESVAQISPSGRVCIIQKDGQIIKETPEFYADPEIFNIFTIPLIMGNPATCLTDPASVVISEQMAQKYFPLQNPINQLLSIRIGEKFKSFTVTGVLQSVSQGSFYKPDILLPMTFLHSLETPEFLTGWNGSGPHTFILFKDKTSIEHFKSKLPTFSEQCIKKGYFGYFDIQPLTKMHLYSGNIEGTIGEVGSIAYVLIFSMIGLFILFMGCINFVNLSTAQSIKRATEVGIRKVLGAGQNQIRIQYLAESILMSLIALPFAFGLLELFLPYGNRLLNRHLAHDFQNDYLFLGGVLVLTILVGLFSGSYIAFFMSRLQAVDILKSKVKISSSKSRFRKVLLTFQFFIFIALIISSLSMFQQMNYIQHKQLGYNKEQLLALNLPEDLKVSRVKAFNNEVKTIPGVKQASICSFVPPNMGIWCSTPIPNPAEPDKDLSISYIISDLDYIETIEFKVKYGRFYSKNMEDVSNRRLVLNEAAIRLLNLESPVGQKIKTWGGEWEIIGVIQDFHTHSMHSRIPPLFFLSTDQIDDFDMRFLRNYAIRIHAGAVPETLQQIKQVWYRFFSEEYFDYRFADEEFDRLHRNDLNLSHLLLIFTITAIVLSSMGLLGLISLTAQNRTKEMGIRKTFGASRFQILGLLTKEYSRLFLISIVIAIPVALYFVKQWLKNFAYQANIGFFTFSFAILLAFMIMAGTVCWQAIRAARANPIQSLRYE